MGRAKTSTMACMAVLAAATAATPVAAETRRHAWVPPWALVQLPGPPWGTRVVAVAGLAFAPVAARGCARVAVPRYDFDGNVVEGRRAARCG